MREYVRDIDERKLFQIHRALRSVCTASSVFVVEVNCQLSHVRSVHERNIGISGVEIYAVYIRNYFIERAFAVQRKQLDLVVVQSRLDIESYEIYLPVSLKSNAIPDEACYLPQLLPSLNMVMGVKHVLPAFFSAIRIRTHSIEVELAIYLLCELVNVSNNRQI